MNRELIRGRCHQAGYKGEAHLKQWKSTPECKSADDKNGIALQLTLQGYEVLQGRRS
jgi:hypothetical protein